MDEVAGRDTDQSQPSSNLTRNRGVPNMVNIDVAVAHGAYGG